ncbi:MAG TPA: phosphoribosylglycinamide formyltransferase [Candidatus Gallibacteroides avistercoris]|uniref:Phosphoribosylglycinamide formyltransferase n=1 Tax=Candidatus Gallibacteroides avistercoris TaxID=2840833 RepID=A0A9D1M7S4_9BACT|nr:phosphoribosylglycinamide formyltransferase [Candidatus Gallibacteroides avistercoris]
MKRKIAIFASGTGSNALNLITYFSEHPLAEVVLLVSNNPNAGALQHAARLNVPSAVFDKAAFNRPEIILSCLQQHGIDLIVLAGFLLHIPTFLVEAFPQSIINLHPALLPKFGGKGMYGMHVHRAVKEAGETLTGITIHYINEHYDEGMIIAQYSCPVEADDTPETIAQKVHRLEYRYYPLVIEQLLSAAE